MGCDSTCELSWRPSRSASGPSDPSRPPYLAPESRSAADLAADLAAGITTSPPTSERLAAIWAIRDRDSRNSSPGSTSSAAPQDPTGLWRALEGDKGAAAVIQARQRRRRDRRQLAAQLAAAEYSSETT